jgi:hypothetical protein
VIYRKVRKKVDVVKPEQFHKMTIVFPQNVQKSSIIVILLICPALATVVFFSVEINHVIYQPTANYVLEQM